MGYDEVLDLDADEEDYSPRPLSCLDSTCNPPAFPTPAWTVQGGSVGYRDV